MLSNLTSAADVVAFLVHDPGLEVDNVIDCKVQ